MPIFVDSNEMRQGGTIKLNEQDVIIVDNLEELTGADIMLSPLNLPVTTDKIIQIHLNNNAILVQRKGGMDLKASMGERMNDSLSKMRSYSIKSPQCVLLFIGVMSINSDGYATINTQDTQTPFFNIQSAVSKWHDRGGVVEYIPRESLLKEWCDMKLKHLEEYKEHPEKQYIASPPAVGTWDDILQKVHVVKDGRQLLACLPGIGNKIANLLWDEFDGNLITALCWLTTENSEKKIAGIGEKTKQNVKEYFGMDEVMYLTLEVDEDMLEKIKEKRNG